MKTSNPMQLKAFIKNIAIENNIPPQFAMQTYMMERLLERISLSEYKRQFIIKGGFLISAMIGLDMRATMDIDATLVNAPLNLEYISEIIGRVVAVEVDDDIEFVVKNISDIRKSEEYSGFRVSLEGTYPPIAQPLTIDITTGDKITPREIEFMYPLLFDKKNIPVLAYNIETLLAEKIETIISRGISTTRPRDFYDVYMLWKLERGKIDAGTLGKALIATCENRKSIDEMNIWQDKLADIKANASLRDYWETYRKEFAYASGIEFEATCEVVGAILEILQRQG